MKTFGPGGRGRKALIAAVALGFVFGPPAAMLAGVTTKTNIDNRAMSPAPTLDEGFDALDKVGPWATDRLAGRGEAIRTKSWIDYHLLKELPASGKVIRGSDGYLFHGDEFTVACKYDPVFESSLESFAKLAEIIERSGRKAVVTMGVNKSAVVTEHLPDALPAGDCAKRAVAHQNEILDNFTHPQWVGVRSRLAQAELAGEEPYWRTDTHWSSAGGAVVASALAEHLKPGLEQRLAPTDGGTVSKKGDLTILLGLTSKEEQSTVKLSTGATVIPDPATAQFHPTEMVRKPQHWTTSPSTGLVQGKTLILGDSFAYVAMDNLRQVFADGTFLWTGQVSHKQILDEIEASDTVVIELVQRTLSMRHIYAAPNFHQMVADKLGVPVK